MGALVKHFLHQRLQPGQSGTYVSIDLHLLAVKRPLVLDQRQDVLIAFVQFHHQGREAAQQVIICVGLPRALLRRVYCLP
jgi:hypothetical protein